MTASCSRNPADLLLHRGSMLLISRILHVDAGSAEVEIDISGHSSFFIPGKGVPGWIGIEYMSQAAAVIAGYQGRHSNATVPQGYLRRRRSTRAGRTGPRHYPDAP
jgi:predicted hotdog family 3-hydroxylacyl-ACP dehydratase